MIHSAQPAAAIAGWQKGSACLLRGSACRTGGSSALCLRPALSRLHQLTGPSCRAASGVPQDIDAFKEQLRRTEGKPEYSFYDGPPFATGLPHYGHLLAGTLKVGSDWLGLHTVMG